MSPRQSQPAWRDLRLGMTVAVIASALLAVVVVLGSGRGPLRPKTYTLYVMLDDAAGLRVGSPVRVGGADAGQVVDVSILPPAEKEPLRVMDSLGHGVPVPPEQNIRIELQLDESFQAHVTTSSRAELASLGLGGERYVKIGAGDVRQPALEPGTIVPTVTSVDLDLVLAKLGRAMNEGQELLYQGNQLREKFENGAGTAGRLLNRESPLYDRVARLQAHAASLADSLQHGSGAIPAWKADGRLAAHVEALRGDIAFLADSSGSLARWSDPVALREAIHGVRTGVADLSGRLERGDGTLGRFLHDEELFVQLRVLQTEVAELVAAVKENPLGYVHISIH